MNAFPPLTGVKTRREGIPGAPPPLAEVRSGCAFFERCPSRMEGTCDTSRPPRIEVAPGHRLSCFLHAQVDQEALHAADACE
jgi:oligopeptide/dipeptide ABC transporter ATP-binding protein